MTQSIAYGWGAPKLAEQWFAKDLDPQDLELAQRLSDAVSLLFLHDVITHANHQKSYDRVTKKVEKMILKRRQRLLQDKVLGEVLT